MVPYLMYHTSGTGTYLMISYLDTVVLCSSTVVLNATTIYVTT